MQCKLSLVFLFLVPLGALYGQDGCTDPQATNFDPLANINDGSCEYPPTSYELDLISDLTTLFMETSGLAFLDGKLWTHNDGGNADKIYRIDTLTGNLAQQVTVAGGDNIDWEDMAQDDQYLYVGDFGNNSGDRQDLVIYRINQSELGSNVVNADLIEFSYEDQTNYDPAPFQTNYDCEAFFIMDDSLHLLTKHWLDYKTKHYVLPAEPGEHVARLRDSFDVQLLITAADRSTTGEIVLLGWNPITGNAAFWLLFDHPEKKIFGGNRRRINLGFASQNSQPEGLVFSSQYGGFVSSENFLNYPQRLLRFSIEEWVTEVVSTDETAKYSDIILVPNPGNQEFCLEGMENGTEFEVSVFDIQGKQVFGPLNTSETCIQPELHAGTYFVKIESGKFRQIIKWISR